MNLTKYLFFSLVAIFLLIQPTAASAYEGLCSPSYNITFDPPNPITLLKGESFKYTLTIPGTVPDDRYYIDFNQSGPGLAFDLPSLRNARPTYDSVNNISTIEWEASPNQSIWGQITGRSTVSYTMDFKSINPTWLWKDDHICTFAQPLIINFIDEPPESIGSCTINTKPSPLMVNQSFSTQVTNAPPDTNICFKTFPGAGCINRQTDHNGTANFENIAGINSSGYHSFEVRTGLPSQLLCGRRVYVCLASPCEEIVDEEDEVVKFELCKQAFPQNENSGPEDLANFNKCQDCLLKSGVWTAIGCLNFHPEALVIGILRTAIGLGGGFSLLLMLYGAFVINTSAGNPERVQQGKERFSAAIIGLLLIIFSVVILNFIGIQILQLPGL